MADGGGLTLAAPLTADLVARAVIAAARSYGDDPVHAMTSTARFGRRALAAAASGVARAMEVSPIRAARILQIKDTNVYTARARASADFVAAELAATRAVEFAAWRPQAAEDDAAALEGEEPLAMVQVEVIEPGPRTALPGPAAARMRPSPPPSDARGASVSSPIRDLILKALAERPLNTMSLAYLVDSKEMAVSSTLVQLEHEGLVQYRTVENGPRRFEWLLKAAA